MSRKKRKQEIMVTESAEEVREQEAKKRIKPLQIWRWGILLALVGALTMWVRYSNISIDWDSSDPSLTEKVNAELFSRYNYVLYRDLYNAANDTYLSYEQLYQSIDYENLELKINEEMADYFRTNFLPYEPDLSEGSTESADSTEDSVSSQEELYEYWKNSLQESVRRINAYIEERLGTLRQTMQGGPYNIVDYWMKDQETGTIITNTLQTDQQFSVEEYAVWFQMTYDAAGNVMVNEAKDSDIDGLTKTLYESARKGLYEAYIKDQSYIDNFVDFTESYWINQVENLMHNYGGPRSCTVIYGIKQSQWEQLIAADRNYTQFWRIYQQYESDSLGFVFVAISAVLFAGGFFYGNPRKREKQLQRQFYRVPAEVAVFGSVVYLGIYSLVIEWAARLYQNHNPHYYLRTWWTWEDILYYVGNLLLMAGLFLTAWYLGGCIGEVRSLGIRGYLRRRMVISRIWNWCKERVKRYYQTLINLDITRDTRKHVIRLLLINAAAVLLLCTLWVVGWFGVILYTLLLYFIIKKYISDLQKKYSILLRATNEIANGNLEVKIEENLGIFEPFKPQIYRIEAGFQKAVEEEVKSQRMKTELITNVSHDLKTPLTAIITYVNLLKEDNVTEEQRKQYLQILDQKSLRLKALIEDLFEVSKANSKNITLNLVDVDLVNLLRQVEFEQEDRLAEKHLTVRLRLPEEKVMVRLDSQKAYRIYENLFGNIVKYAMEGTRIYVDLACAEGEVTVKLKNITEQEITVSAEELTERFVRGDASRNTEGSGLGLAIVRSFTELMGGRFSVTVDGDLFTASTTWPLAERGEKGKGQGLNVSGI
ncbi:MAG: HAMP domain-containing histidine kinase [Lachnospiraceae bacterium]|nr:HAMP domain-containing histidine kinase [Lachnospiraceae bacterium]